jgi:cytochrome c2
MRYRKSITLFILMLLVVGLSAFMPQAEEKKRNLKVLPKDISKEDLDKVMDGFKVGLGVRCNFCHAAQSDNQKRLDFASDAKPEKETARMMMRMTAKINKKFFHIKDMQDGKALLAVSCITCHRGNAHPEEAPSK